jgi:hypothetical protein
MVNKQWLGRARDSVRCNLTDFFKELKSTGIGLV